VKLLWLWTAHCCGYEQHTVVVMNSTLLWLWTAHCCGYEQKTVMVMYSTLLWLCTENCFGYGQQIVMVMNRKRLWLCTTHCYGYELHTVVVMNSTLLWLWTAYPVALYSLHYKTPLHNTICYSECASFKLDTFWTGNMQTVCKTSWTFFGVPECVISEDHQMWHLGLMNDLGTVR
jgi:hypothetical protein